MEYKNITKKLFTIHSDKNIPSRDFIKYCDLCGKIYTKKEDALMDIEDFCSSHLNFKTDDFFILDDNILIHVNYDFDISVE